MRSKFTEKAFILHRVLRDRRKSGKLLSTNKDLWLMLIVFSMNQRGETSVYGTIYGNCLRNGYDISRGVLYHSLIKLVDTGLLSKTNERKFYEKHTVTELGKMILQEVEDEVTRLRIRIGREKMKKRNGPPRRKDFIK